MNFNLLPMPFDDFFNKNNNQSVETVDPSALDQCVDLFIAWCDALGIPRIFGNVQYAYQIYENFTSEQAKYFDRVANGPNNKPPKGAAVVFKRISGIPVGHVSIETGKSDLMNAITFDQNWDTLHYYHLDSHGNHIPYCRTVVHSGYYGVEGWLIPKNIPQPLTCDQKLSKVIEEVKSGNSDGDKVSHIKSILGL